MFCVTGCIANPSTCWRSCWLSWERAGRSTEATRSSSKAASSRNRSSLSCEATSVSCSSNRLNSGKFCCCHYSMFDCVCRGIRHVPHVQVTRDHPPARHSALLLAVRVVRIALLRRKHPIRLPGSDWQARCYAC